MHYWLEKGAPAEKIILGMGTYGRSFTLERQENHGLQAAAPQKGTPGPYTREAGSLGYNEICEAFGREKWTVVNDLYHMAPYAYKERQWVGYDDIDSLAIKARFAVQMGFGGGMVWSIETDDFLGGCHGVKFPLIQTINKVFATEKNPVVPTPPPTVETEDNGIPTSSTQSPTSSSTIWWPTSTTSSTPSSTWWSQTSSTTTTTSAPPSSSTRASVPSSSIPWWETTYDYGSTSTQSSSTPSSEIENTTPKKNTPVWEHEEETTPRPATSISTSKPTTWTTGSSVTPELSTPSRPNDGGGIHCKSSGMFRNPSDCKRFYRCVDAGLESRYMIYEFSCPHDTVFDEQTKLCLWPDSVPECSNYYSGGSPSGTPRTSPRKPSGSGNEVEREGLQRTLFKKLTP